MKKTQNSMKTALLAILAFICGAALANAGTETYSWQNLQSDIHGVALHTDSTSLIRGD